MKMTKMTISNIVAESKKYDTAAMVDGMLRLTGILANDNIIQQVQDIIKTLGGQDSEYTRGTAIRSELFGVECALAHLRLAWPNIGDADSIVAPMRDILKKSKPEKSTKK